MSVDSCLKHLGGGIDVCARRADAGFSMRPGPGLRTDEHWLSIPAIWPSGLSCCEGNDPLMKARCAANSGALREVGVGPELDELRGASAGVHAGQGSVGGAAP